MQKNRLLLLWVFWLPPLCYIELFFALFIDLKVRNLVAKVVLLKSNRSNELTGCFAWKCRKGALLSVLAVPIHQLLSPHRCQQGNICWPSLSLSLSLGFFLLEQWCNFGKELFLQFFSSSRENVPDHNSTWKIPTKPAFCKILEMMNLAWLKSNSVWE